MTKINKKKKKQIQILCKTLIGNKIKIIDSKNKKLVGIKGEILFESKNLFYLKKETKKKTKKIIKILKKEIIFEIKFEEKKYIIDGKLFNNNLITRIKKFKF